MHPRKEYLFLALTVILSIPFYLWGALAPVSGLPFGLPISFLMIFIPLLLSMVYAWQENGRRGIITLFKSSFQSGRGNIGLLVVSVSCMPIVMVLTYYLQKTLRLPLPDSYSIGVSGVLPMIVLYFIGAIPEELGWSYTITKPLVEKHGIVGAGAMIGFVWALWHVIPWSWAHSPSWVAGMIVLNMLMRIVMTYLYTVGNGCVLCSILFHAMINVSFGVFPVNGSYVITWVACIGMLCVGSIFIFVERKFHLIPG